MRGYQGREIRVSTGPKVPAALARDHARGPGLLNLGAGESRTSLESPVIR